MSRCLDTTSTMDPGEFIDAVVEIFQDNVDGFPGLLKLIEEMNDRDEEAYDNFQAKKRQIAELTAEKANLGLVVDIVKDENEVNKKNMFKARAQLQQCEAELCSALEERDQADDMVTELSHKNENLESELDHYIEVTQGRRVNIDEKICLDGICTGKTYAEAKRIIIEKESQEYWVLWRKRVTWGLP